MITIVGVDVMTKINLNSYANCPCCGGYMLDRRLNRDFNVARYILVTSNNLSLLCFENKATCVNQII